jgi:hypothetical protein
MHHPWEPIAPDAEPFVTGLRPPPALDPSRGRLLHYELLLFERESESASARWELIPTANGGPPARGSQRLIPRGDGSRAFLFQTGDPDVWEVAAVPRGSWVDRAQAITPLPREWGFLIGDAARSRALMFSGRSRVADLWSFDYQTRQWTEITPPGTSPPARADAIAVHDTRRDRVLMFGGFAEDLRERLRDTWALSLSTMEWEELTVGCGPVFGADASAIYDPASDLIVAVAGTRELDVGAIRDDDPDRDDRDVWVMSLERPGWVRARGNREHPAYGSTHHLTPIRGAVLSFSRHAGPDPWVLDVDSLACAFD